MKTTLNLNGQLVDLNQNPLVMGVLNVNDDSFYENSRVSVKSALELAISMINDGADILDLGAYSSKPGAKVVSQQEEIDNLIPAIESIIKKMPNAIISVDTGRAEVSELAIKAGAKIINDVFSLEGGNENALIAKKFNVPYVLMHMQGNPQNMQNNPQYENVLVEVFLSLKKRIIELRALGLKDIILDPGFGFGKSVEHNFTLLHHLESFLTLECPLLVGFSRKSMINKELNTKPENALNGTSVLNAFALQKGASILRVHDVKEAKESILLYNAMIFKGIAHKSVQKD